MNILIADDSVPIPSNYLLFDTADLNNLIGNEMKYLLERSDFFIFNLQTSLGDNSIPIAR